MTPFGRRIRELRAERGVTQKEMAAALEVSAAWLSALEKGHRGRPSWNFIQRVIAYFNIIWDDADEIVRLAHISHPRIVVDTSDLSADATEFANLVADHVGELSEDDLRHLMHELKRLSVAASKRRAEP
ncbi:MAG: helix-turn-helix domain-containing protein [Pseudomonadota bacterium]|nr:helix-turn-helix domain-containing protein [Pseudomonadota bacterium]